MQSFERRPIPAIVTILLGIMLLTRPAYVISRGMWLIGIALMAAGLLHILLRAQSFGSLSVIGGITAILTGAVIFSRRRAIVSILPTAAGLMIIVSGLLNLTHSYGQGRFGEPKWLQTALLSVIEIALGLYIFIHPFKTVNMIARAVGCMFIYNGALELILGRRAGRHH